MQRTVSWSVPGTAEEPVFSPLPSARGQTQQAAWDDGFQDVLSRRTGEMARSGQELSTKNKPHAPSPGVRSCPCTTRCSSWRSDTTRATWARTAARARAPCLGGA